MTVQTEMLLTRNWTLVTALLSDAVAEMVTKEVLFRVSPLAGEVMLTLGAVKSALGSGVGVGVGTAVGVGVGEGAGFSVSLAGELVRLKGVAVVSTSCRLPAIMARFVSRLEVVTLGEKLRVASLNDPVGAADKVVGSRPAIITTLPPALASAMVLKVLTRFNAGLARVISWVSFSSAGSKVNSALTNAMGLSVVTQTLTKLEAGRESVAGSK